MLDKTLYCLCSFWEACELCDPNSEYNKLLNKDKPKPTLEDYGKSYSFKVKTEDLYFKYKWIKTP